MVFFVIWAAASAAAYGLAAALAHGSAQSAAAALLAPPLALGFTFALRALLRRSLSADDEAEELARDPDLAESLDQMQRGEGRTVRPRQAEDPER
jgi:hypothetical protein